jgi:streptogrisin C
MQRRPIAVAAAVLAATGAAVAFTLPSLAGTESDRPSSVVGTDGGISPQLLSAMKRDLGIDGDEARSRLARAEWAGGVSAKLAAQTGDDYAGAWLAEDGTTLKVAVTDSDAAAAVKKAGAEPVLVKRSEADLDEAKSALDDAKSSPDDVTGWYVDPKTNKVVVVAQPGAKSEALEWAGDNGVASSAVTVRISEARPKPLFDVRGGDPYFINVGGGQARCSIGFSVEGGFVTAGHCGAEGADTTGFNEEAQGTVEFSVFPGEADMGFVAVNDDWTPRPVVNDFEGNELPVAGNTEAPVGAAVCRSGSTTGTFCGTILSKNETVVYPEGAVSGLTRTDVCAEGGDSGGPWLSGDQAQGMTSGGSGDCTVGGETFFQPLNEVLAAQNLTLVTTEGGAEPPAEEEPPANETASCEGAAVEREGSIAGAGSAQAQPDGGAYRARAGTHSACLDAPEGTDFDLLLQRQNDNGQFRTVAQGEGDGDKTLSFTGQSGTYRYVVVASSGTGDYTLGFDVS